MKCAHCGHTHTNADGRMDIDHCMQCAWIIRHNRRHRVDGQDSACVDFDH